MSCITLRWALHLPQPSAVPMGLPINSKTSDMRMRMAAFLPGCFALSCSRPCGRHHPCKCQWTRMLWSRTSNMNAILLTRCQLL